MTRWALRLRRPAGRRPLRSARPAPAVMVTIPRLEEMEVRLAPAALITPTPTAPTAVGNVTSGNQVYNQFADSKSAGDFSSPVVAVDPLNSSNQVMVTQARRDSDGLLDIVGQYSTNAGASWTQLSGLANRLTDQTKVGDGATARPFLPNASQPSVAFGRDGNFFISYIQSTVDYAVGALVVQSYSFSSAGPGARPITPSYGAFFKNFGTSTQQILYRWSNGLDAAYNPTVALDSNLPVYTDAETGTTFRDTLVDPNTGRPKAVYVAWNTIGTVPSGQDFPNNTGVLFNPNAVFASVSTDTGFNFSAPIAVNGSGLTNGSPGTAGLLLGPRAGYLATNADTNTGGGAPVIGFSPGTSAAPGRAVIGWAGAVGTGTGSLNYDISSPDGGLTNSAAGSVRSFGVSYFNGDPRAAIADAAKGDTNDTPAISNFVVSVTSNDIIGLTTTDLITNLTVSMAFRHTDVAQLNVELVAPDGTVIRLFQNRLLTNGNTPNAGGVFNQPPGLPASPGRATPQQSLGLGRSVNSKGTQAYGTTFDDYAPRRITDPANSFPYIGSYKPDSWNPSAGALSRLTGRPVSSLVGNWTLRITDVRNDRITENFPDLSLDYFAVNVTAASKGVQSLVPGMAADAKVQTFNADKSKVVSVQIPAASADGLTAAGTTVTANDKGGIGPGLSIAFDTSIQPYNNLTQLTQLPPAGNGSPYVSPPGLLYFLYNSPGSAKTGFDIHLSRGVLSPTAVGGTANFFYANTGNPTITRVNDDVIDDSGDLRVPGAIYDPADDTPNDNFSEGNRAQFQPSLAVDPQTGTVAVMWYDGRYDAAETRVATYIAMSIDGGYTFSQSQDGFTLNARLEGVQTPGKQVSLSQPLSGIDAITYGATGGSLAKSSVYVEPVPTIISSIPGPLGIGQRQSLVAIGAGKFASYWTGNQNLPTLTAAKNAGLNFTGSTVFRNVTTGAAGPRVIYGDMGAIDGDSLDSIFVAFDRPVDVSSFAAGDIEIRYLSPTGVGRTLVPGVDYADPQPAAGPLPPGFPPIPNAGTGGRGGNASTLFVIPFFTPQTAVGTYSYTVGPSVRDLVRSVQLTGGFTNNAAVPGPFNTNPNPISADIPPASFSPSPVPTVTPSVTSYPIAVSDPGGGLLVRTPRVTVDLVKPTGGDPDFPAAVAGSLRDITVELVAPNGTAVVLFDGTLRGFGGNAVAAEYRAPADGGVPQPFAGDVTGTFSPDGNFDLFLGAAIPGTWNLRVTNRVAADQPVGAAPPGTVNSWSLSFTTVTRNTVVSPGNLMDQNNDGVAGTSLDLFAAPRPDAALGNTTPFTFPYDSLTSPLIVTGPKYAPPAAENLTVNGAARFVDVSFDRPIDAASFTDADVLRILGPTGTIYDKNLWDAQFPGKATGISVAPLDPTTFRVSFPAQVISGNYNIEFGPNITDLLGNLQDNNRNAGLDVLRGGDPFTGQVARNTYNSTGGPVAITPGQAVSMPLTVTDLFVIEQTLAQRINVRIDVTHPNVPDLIVDLVHPNGTSVRLATSVGTAGTARANFSNTRFDDGGVTPIQLGLAPFSAGPYTPQFPLSAFRDLASTVKDAGGADIPWRLRVTNSGTRTGSINNFSLVLPRVVAGTGLGEAVDDRFTVPFRVFTQDATNPLTKQVWTPVGPAPSNAAPLPTVSDNTSRITGVAMDPSDPSGNTVYAGGASGGIWKSTNFLTLDPNGPNWQPLTDFGPTDGLNTGSIAVFPRNNDTNQSIIFALTGEGDTGSRGVGVLRSLDGGRTWKVLDSTNNADGAGNILPIDSPLRDRNFFGSYGYKLIVDPTATPTGDVIVYLAVGGTNGGVYRSTDTGRTFQRLRAGQATDVFLAAGSRSTSPVSSGALEFLYAAFQGEGIFTTAQAPSATTMTLAAGGQGNPLIRDIDTATDKALPVAAPADTPNGAKGRIQIVGPSATGDVLADSFYAGWLYAIVSTPGTAGQFFGGGNIDGLYLTKDFGRNWVKVRIPAYVPPNSPAGVAYPSNDITLPDHDIFGQPSIPGQGNYDISIAIDVNDPRIVYVGGNGIAAATPASGVIRVDTSAVFDSGAFVQFDNGSALQTGEQSASGGGVTPSSDATQVISLTIPPPLTGQSLLTANFFNNVFNLSRNPDSPFLSNATVLTTNGSTATVPTFTNTGANASYQAFSVFHNTADTHRFISFRDQQTGKTRLILTGDQQIATGVDDGQGNFVPLFAPFTNPQAFRSASFSRNGNLQIFQAYAGAAQPSQLAADLAQALFYGQGQDNGFPVSAATTLETGALSWVGPPGDGSGVAVDQTGSGTAYQYRWPCCQGEAALATDFFRVLDAPAPGGSSGVSRTNGLLQAGDDPAANQGQWPLIADVGYFAVNPIDPNGILISSAVGRIFRTTNRGINWFPVGEPTELDGTYARATAFGAPDPAVPGQLNNFLYAGTAAGNVFVSFTGGAPWTNISQGIAGNGPVMQIVPNPQRGSRSAYAVTTQGVFFLADARIGQWVELSGVSASSVSGNLFDLRQPIFGDANNDSTNPLPNSAVPLDLRSLNAIAADWRYAIPADPNFPTQNTFPILYVGGAGGVYRSINGGQSWEIFPASAQLVDPETGEPLLDPITGQPQVTPRGGYLPNVEVTDLDLSLGNIDPLTGFPQQSSGGFNMLTASTYGRGMFAIRLEEPASVAQYNVLAQSGPRVAGLAARANTAASTAVRVRYDAAVVAGSFTPADIVLTDSTGAVIPVESVVPVPNLVNGVDQRNLFELTFTPNRLEDSYTIAVGQSIFDFAGFGMNQNGDKRNGDATVNPDTGFSVDAYVGSFVTIAGAQQGNLFVSQPPVTRAGDPVPVTVAVTDPNGLQVTGFKGSVSFTSSDPRFNEANGIPAGSKLTVNLDGGSKTVAVFYITSTVNPPAPATTLTVTDPAGNLAAAVSSIVVRGGAAATFDVAGIASPTKAGVARDVTVTARDKFGNIADGFVGQVTFSSSDPLVTPGNGLPDLFTFTAANQGKATAAGLVALKTAGLQSVSVTDALSGNVVGKQSNILVTPEVAASVRVSGHPSLVVAGTKSDFRVTAFDKFGNTATGYAGTVAFTSSDKQVSPGSGLPANYTFTAADAGSRLFQSGAQLKTAGTQSITATDTKAAFTGTQTGITVVAAAAAKFAISGYPSPTVAGVKGDFTVFATDAFGNRSNNFVGTVRFTSSDPLVSPGSGLPNAYTFSASDGGTKTFAGGAQLKTAGTQSISVTDDGTGFTGSQAGIVVVPAAGTLVRVSGFPNPATAGVAGSLTVSARDPFGNVAAGYTGTVAFTSTDKQVGVGNGLPAAYTFTAADKGSKTFTGVLLRTAGLQTITATDTATGSVAGFQDGILVSAAPASSLAVTGFPSPVVAGQGRDFTVTARDPFGNLAADYAGTVIFTSSDLQVGPNKGLPLSYTFAPADGGKRTFTAALRTAGTQSVTATDILTPGLTGTQGGIAVVAGSLSRLTVAGYPSPVVAGLDTGLTVSAADAFGNPVAGFVGTVAFSTTDPQGTVPTAYAFTPADNGRKTFTGGFTLRTAGSQSISGSVVGNAALTGTQTNVTVVAADATTFALTNFPATINALVPATFTVTAFDPFGNVAVGYNGTATVTSSDARAAIDNPIRLTNGVGTGRITFRTSGTQSVTVTDATTGGVAGTAGGLAVAAAPPGVVEPGAVSPLSLPALTAVGTEAGVPSLVSVLNPDGSLRSQFAPYGPEYTGGVRVALQRTPFGPRVVVAPGVGTPPEVRVYDPATGEVVQTLLAFEETFTGGVFVATGDINTDGYDDIILSPDNGGGPRVRVLDGRTLGTVADFFGIDDPNFRGGVRAAVTDVNGDGTNDLVVAAGFGGGPRVAIFDGKSVLTGTPSPDRLVSDFFAFEPELRNGAFVSGGDVNGDGFGDLAFGAGPGGGPRVRVVSGKQIVLASPFPNLDLVPQAQIGNFFAGNPAETGGVRVTMRQLSTPEDGSLAPAAVITGSGSGNTLVTSYTAEQILGNVTPNPLWQFEGLSGATNGVFVG